MPVQNYVVLREYASFLIDIQNANDKASKYIIRADEIEELQKSFRVDDSSFSLYIVIFYSYGKVLGLMNILRSLQCLEIVKTWVKF